MHTFFHPTCHFYIPRQPLTQAWLTTWLHDLWQHGLQFIQNQDRVALTWEEMLATTVWSSESQPGHTVPLSLNALIDSLVTQGSGMLDLYDLNVRFDVVVNPDLHVHAGFGDVSQYNFGYIAFSINRAHFNHDDILTDLRTQSHVQVPFSEQVFLTYTHWFRQLCHILRPAYAFAESGEFDGQVMTKMVVQALQQREVPDIRSLVLGDEDLQYVDAALVQPGLIEQWLQNEHTWVQRQSDGSLMKLIHQETYDERDLEYYGDAAELALKQSDAEQAIRFWEQAWRIAQTTKAGKTYWVGRLRGLAFHIRQSFPNASLLAHSAIAEQGKPFPDQ